MSFLLPPNAAVTTSSAQFAEPPNGTYCRVPLEETNADNAPDCAAVNYAKASSAEALAEWQAQLDQPYSDAWKCARLE